ncbi:integrin alpha-E-like isoform X2 [Acipenser ruthenus]|uniref:integrin alpha-E-like isoform X2 n=1 Tax=Acipenser ruthenus TaxID=7906 RepID=UPI00274265A3|nr:integrin alpha-E-like isoform X2 [Acipenser ruthenus]
MAFRYIWIWITTVLGAVECFNIYTKPQHTLRRDERTLYGQTVLQYNDGILVTAPLDTSDRKQYGKLYQCDLKSDCNDVKLGDGGTEIAFVLDGSGSIEADDFQSAKDFISNMMTNIWENCFSCGFAIVQYGEEIQTELTLNENNDTESVLKKVQDIKQLGRITKTASAIQHVLDHIFIEEKGSQKNARKIIIVITDGDIFRDPLDIEDVMKSPKMTNVTRFAIGVGEVFETPKVRELLYKIASEPEEEHVFKVDNYAALDGLLALLEKSITGIEGFNSPAGANSNNHNNNAEDLYPDEEEDGGTEFAFVLDGSGSIEADDFQRAKDFISNMMTNIWENCFSCGFAIVQYGEEIQTELTLNENNDTESVLKKVQDIKQLGMVTKTASAIQHVLDHIFIEEKGSQKNARKIIIVITDGDIFRDPLDIEDVMKSPKMTNVTRFAIGVGKEFESLKTKELLHKIASEPDEEHVFKLDNYAALDGLLALLEKSITGIEGYSVVAVKGTSGNLFVSGAPRHSLTGRVLVFGGDTYEIRQNLSGTQVGSYFGSELCALDVDQNGITDYLLVGAPFFHIRGEEGKVYVYKLNNDDMFEEPQLLQGMEGYDFARFGIAISNIGDVDRNGYNDIAIGAPLEVDSPGSSGSVYIYNGFSDGIRMKYSQRIAAVDVNVGLKYFGQSVDGMTDLNNDSWIDITVGSLGTVTVFQSLVVVNITAVVKFDPERIPLSYQSSMNKPSNPANTVGLKICFQTKLDWKTFGHAGLAIEYNVYVDTEKENKRMKLADRESHTTTFNITEKAECLQQLTLQFLGCHDDCFSPIAIKVNFTLQNSSAEPPHGILNAFSDNENIAQLHFENNCGKDMKCIPNLSLSTNMTNDLTLIVGGSREMVIAFNLQNSGEDSYMTTMELIYPSILHYNKISLFQENTGTSCEDPDSLGPSLTRLRCKIGFPVFRKQSHKNFTISWQLDSMKSEKNVALINISVSCKNDGLNLLVQENHRISVKHSLKMSLTGEASPLFLNITEDMKSNKHPLKYVFKINGENHFGAEVKANISIPLKRQGGGKLTITKVNFTKKSTHCTWHTISLTDVHATHCTVRDEQEDITIEAELLIDAKEVTVDKIKATAVLGFDKDWYVAEETDQHIKEVSVTIEKLTAYQPMALIIGSSIGGFVILAILVFILFKCGFFKRDYKQDVPEEEKRLRGRNPS